MFFIFSHIFSGLYSYNIVVDTVLCGSPFPSNRARFYTISKLSFAFAYYVLDCLISVFV